MSTIPRIFLNKKLINSIKPPEGTLSFATLDIEMINIIVNLYNYFKSKEYDTEIFTLTKLFRICCPDDPLAKKNGNVLSWKLDRFKKLLIKHSTLIYAYPILNSSGQLSLHPQPLYILNQIKTDDQSAKEKYTIAKAIADINDGRCKSIYRIKISEQIKSEFIKYTNFTKNSKHNTTNYIVSKLQRLDNSRGWKSTKIKKIQQVLNEEISIKKIKIKKKQPIKMVSELDLVDFVIKMGELKTFKKNPTRYLISLKKCFDSLIDSTYPVTGYEIINKKIKICFKNF